MSLQQRCRILALTLGHAIAHAFATEGATVVAADLRPEPHGIAVDVSDETSVLRLFDEVRAEHGRLDVCANNAGIVLDTPLLTSTVVDFDCLRTKRTAAG